MNMKRHKIDPIFSMYNKKENGSDKGSQAGSMVLYRDH